MAGGGGDDAAVPVRSASQTKKRGTCNEALIEHSTALLTFVDQPTHDTGQGRTCDLSRISRLPWELTHQFLSMYVEREKRSWYAEMG